MTRLSYSRNPLSGNTGTAASNGMMQSSRDASPETAMSRSSWPTSVGTEHDTGAQCALEHDHRDLLAVLVKDLLALHPLRDHLIDSGLVGTEAERPARQVRVFPGVFGGLQQSRNECRLELGDPGRLRFEFQDVRPGRHRPRIRGTCPSMPRTPPAHRGASRADRLPSRAWHRLRRPMRLCRLRWGAACASLFSTLSTAASRASRPGGRR